MQSPLFYNAGKFTKRPQESAEKFGACGTARNKAAAEAPQNPSASLASFLFVPCFQ
jgi:hypothetical protein